MIQRYGVLGSGQVGQVLAKGLKQHGYQVMIGSRTPAKLAEFGKANGIATGTFGEVAKWGEGLVLAVAGPVAQQALEVAGAANLKGKVVIDATNPLVFTPGAPPGLALGHTDSGGEQVQRWLPEARVVKCFNMVGHAHMVSPSFPGGPPDMFYCGNDAAAKKTVATLLTQFGWPSTDMGGIEFARVLEPLCILWVTYGARTGGWNHALKMLRK